MPLTTDEGRLTKKQDFLVVEWFEKKTGFLLGAKKVFVGEEDFSEATGMTHSEGLFALPIELESEARQRVFDLYGVDTGDRESLCVVRRARGTDFLPYDVHTNRELELMNRGLKPLSVFSEATHVREDWLDAISARFLGLAAPWRFVQRRYTRLPAGALDVKRRATSVLLVAREAEEWRIDAYILAMSCADQVGWNDGFECVEGTLLGYEAWQTEAYLRLKRGTDVNS
jgi:hypothetical protein